MTEGSVVAELAARAISVNEPVWRRSAAWAVLSVEPTNSIAPPSADATPVENRMFDGAFKFVLSSSGAP